VEKKLELGCLVDTTFSCKGVYCSGLIQRLRARRSSKDQIKFNGETILADIVTLLYCLPCNLTPS
jgi:hypothetical protein